MTHHAKNAMESLKVSVRNAQLPRSCSRVNASLIAILATCMTHMTTPARKLAIRMSTRAKLEHITVCHKKEIQLTAWTVQQETTALDLHIQPQLFSARPDITAMPKLSWELTMILAKMQRPSLKSVLLDIIVLKHLQLLLIVQRANIVTEQDWALLQVHAKLATYAQAKQLQLALHPLLKEVISVRQATIVLQELLINCLADLEHTLTAKVARLPQTV